MLKKPFSFFAPTLASFDATLIESTNQCLQRSRRLLADTADLVDTKLRWKLLGRPACDAEPEPRQASAGGDETVKAGDGI